MKLVKRSVGRCVGPGMAVDGVLRFPVRNAYVSGTGPEPYMMMVEVTEVELSII